MLEAERPTTTTQPVRTTPPLLEVRDLARSFGPTVALASCSFAVTAGEIHALVGENGSGKSTLIKILNGVLPQDRGQLRWQGADIRFRDPPAARRAGIACSFQETLVIEELSVRDNILLGQDGALLRRHRRGRESDIARAALAALGIELELERPILHLSLAQRQLVTIARALAQSWRLLILDESTSALDANDRDRLFEALLRFRDQGRSVLFVSHRMDEIARIADRATVLRGGRSIATLSTREAGTDRLLALMSDALSAHPHASAPADCTTGETVLETHGLVLRAGTAAIDLAVKQGEILGLAGLEGHGQAAFLDIVSGLAHARSGRVVASGRTIRTMADAARAGMGVLPRDRKRDGIFGPLSVADNLAIGRLRHYARCGVLNRARLLAAARDAIDRLRIKVADPRAPITTLSGGNQQKVLLGRLLLTEPRVLVLNDPMRGVDAGAKHDLHEALRALAAQGVAVLFLSTELAELCLTCDRVAVFRDQRIAALLPREALTEQRLIAAMFGQ